DAGAVAVGGPDAACVMLGARVDAAGEQDRHAAERGRCVRDDLQMAGRYGMRLFWGRLGRQDGEGVDRHLREGGHAARVAKVEDAAAPSFANSLSMLARCANHSCVPVAPKKWLAVRSTPIRPIWRAPMCRARQIATCGVIRPAQLNGSTSGSVSSGRSLSPRRKLRTRGCGRPRLVRCVKI